VSTARGGDAAATGHDFHGNLKQMANTCSVCGKGAISGQNIRHPHSGAWALRAPRTKRQFKPNLQSVRTPATGGATKRVKVCTKCLKANKIVRAL
jgi:large subunit ribosomal protein L28